MGAARALASGRGAARGQGRQPLCRALRRLGRRAGQGSRRGHDRALRPSRTAMSAINTALGLTGGLMLSQADNEFLTPQRPRHADGRPAAPLLDAGAALRRTARARRAAEEDQDPGRGPARLPQHRRPRRHRRAALPASRRQPLLRPQRGVRPALRLPWLEVRRRRQLRRPADLAAGVLLQGHDQAARLPDARMGRHDLGLHGPAREDAGAAAARDGAGAVRRNATSARSGRTATGCRASRAPSTPRTSPSCTPC